MKPLDQPTIAGEDLLNDCLSEITAPPVLAIYNSNKPYLETGITQYAQSSNDKSWFGLPQAALGNPNQVICGSITKKQLTDLYSTHIVKSKGIPRQHYHEILVTADGKCPFCGGIGHVSTLDHYLPKARFPLYSIVPQNLVPSCKDCNTGKNIAFAQTQDQQTMHPYFEAAHFYQEKWVFGQIVATDPISVTFDVRPPEDWSATDKNRVTAHFESYELSKRYAIEAAVEISTVLNQRQNSLAVLSNEQFKTYLQEQANDQTTPINGWKRVLYAALSEADAIL